MSSCRVTPYIKKPLPCKKILVFNNNCYKPLLLDRFKWITYILRTHIVYIYMSSRKKISYNCNGSTFCGIFYNFGKAFIPNLLAIGNAFFIMWVYFFINVTYRYRMDLKDILKRRDLDIEKCVRSTDEVMQQVALEVFKGTNIDQIQVALISSVMNIADIYRSRKFSILLLKSALAQLESEDFIESGSKLN